MTNWTLEAVATDKEKQLAQEVERAMNKAGYSGTYAGGGRSKGNGFWLRKGNVSLGYKNCRSIKAMLQVTK